MRGWKLTVIETVAGLLVAVALIVTYDFAGLAWTLLGIGVVALALGIADLVATDALISAYPLYILGLESEKSLRIEAKVFGVLITIASSGWIAYWVWHMMSGGVVWPLS